MVLEYLWLVGRTHPLAPVPCVKFAMGDVVYFKIFLGAPLSCLSPTPDVNHSPFQFRVSYSSSLSTSQSLPHPGASFAFFASAASLFLCKYLSLALLISPSVLRLFASAASLFLCKYLSLALLISPSVLRLFARATSACCSAASSSRLRFCAASI